MNKHCFAAFPTTQWVFNDNSMKQLLTLKWQSNSSYLKYLFLIFSLMTPQPVIPLSTGCEDMLLA